MDNGNTGGGLTRPEILNSVSDTQMEELDRQFDEGDHDAWHTLATSYGWDEEQCDAVWEYFGQRVQGGGSENA